MEIKIRIKKVRRSVIKLLRLKKERVMIGQSQAPIPVNQASPSPPVFPTARQQTPLKSVSISSSTSSATSPSLSLTFSLNPSPQPPTYTSPASPAIPIKMAPDRELKSNLESLHSIYTSSSKTDPTTLLSRNKLLLL